MKVTTPNARGGGTLLRLLLFVRLAFLTQNMLIRLGYRPVDFEMHPVGLCS
jgi:hypothetical protein